MAEFMSGLHGGGGGGLRPSPFSSFLEMDPTMDLIRFANSTPVFHPVRNENNGTGFFLYSQEVPLHLQPQEDMSGDVVPQTAMNQNDYVGSGNHDGDRGDGDCKNDMKKRRKKPLGFLNGTCSASANSSVTVKRRKQQGSGGGVRGKKIIKGDADDEGGDGRSKEVVHVRARRGQATDSHSLAERVRRGKINERLKCLQDIVPGCYKTMGLAVMLDEIISYVQSLQHQVEFLSMKLTAASSFYDFNSESDLIDAIRKAKAYEAKEMEKLLMKSQLECHSVITAATMFHPFDSSL